MRLWRRRIAAAVMEPVQDALLGGLGRGGGKVVG